MRNRIVVTASCVLLGIAASATLPAADLQSGDNGILLQEASKAKFTTAPGVPACVSLSPLRGDMGKSASTLLVKMSPGCSVPFHWHTPTEELVVLQGKPLGQMLHQRPYLLKVGSYSQLPSHHVHRFRCESKQDCLLFLVADAPFDIHFVDDQGQEITTDAALDAAQKAGAAKW